MTTASTPSAAWTITRTDAIARAVAATLTRYPFLIGVVEPTATIKRQGRDWLVTVWLGTALYQRVRVSPNGQTQLLTVDQAR